MSTPSQIPETLSADLLSMAVIGPNEPNREAIALALLGCQGGQIRQFSNYPQTLDDMPKMLRMNFDVIIIDLDSNTEYALDLVECICVNHSAIVMVYSAQSDQEMLLRCMRAGAREYLTLPVAHSTVAEALIRASSHRPAIRYESGNENEKKVNGKTMVFWGSKGGCGVTTLACNYAVALAKDCKQHSLLIDLDLPLGDVALHLGINTQYSTATALENYCRLDSRLLSTMVVQHSSGLSVLAAPGELLSSEVPNEAIDKLLAVACQDFEYVIVDAGSRLDLEKTDLFGKCATLYLVTQIGISELRNSNRLISKYASICGSKLEIVLNRHESSTLGIDEEHIRKALTKPVQWKIPDSQAAVRRAQNTATPLALDNTPIARMIRQMARTVCGQLDIPEKKRGFGFFR